MRTPAALIALALAVGGCGSVTDRAPRAAERQAQDTVPCQVFPDDNWWHADISDLPRHARSKQWLARMSTEVDLHPDFGSSYGDGPNYGLPVTVVKHGHPRVKVRFQYAD